MEKLLCIGGSLHGHRRDDPERFIEDGPWRYTRRHIGVGDASVQVWCVDHFSDEELIAKLLAAIASVR